MQNIKRIVKVTTILLISLQNIMGTGILHIYVNLFPNNSFHIFFNFDIELSNFYVYIYIFLFFLTPDGRSLFLSKFNDAWWWWWWCGLGVNWAKRMTIVGWIVTPEVYLIIPSYNLLLWVSVCIVIVYIFFRFELYCYKCRINFCINILCSNTDRMC